MKFSTRPYLAVAAALGALACTSPTTTQAKGAAAPAADPNAPVAKIGADAITGKELEEFAKGELKKLDAQFQEQTYQLKRQALDTMIMKRLVDAKAKAAGKSPDEYVQGRDHGAGRADQRRRGPAGLRRRQGPGARPTRHRPGEGDHRPLHPAAEGAGRGPGLLRQAEGRRQGGDPPAAVPGAPPAGGGQGAVARAGQGARHHRRVLRLRVPVLQPRRGTRLRGAATSYRDKVRLVYRDYPLPNHENAPKAAEAAHCAGEQGKYWEMHAKLFANQRALEVPALKGYAKDLKLDQAKFDKCLDSGDKADARRGQQEGGQRGGRRTAPRPSS